MPKYCDVCQGTRCVRLARYPEQLVAPDYDEDFDLPKSLDAMFKEFPCPQCTPTVPYRRVRAMKVITEYEADYFGKFQMPIERSLAARFGEYLLREGLIRFTQNGSKDFGKMTDKIMVTAHLGVVSRENVERAGAVPEIGVTKAPALPRKITDKERVRLRLTSDMDEAVAWDPKPAPWVERAEEPTDEFDEPKDALGARFSGLEID